MKGVMSLERNTMGGLPQYRSPTDDKTAPLARSCIRGTIYGDMA